MLCQNCGVSKMFCGCETVKEKPKKKVVHKNTKVATLQQSIRKLHSDIAKLHRDIAELEN